MSSIFTVQFWRETLERAIKTAAQSTILALGIGEGFNVFSMDWKLAAGFAGGGLILSVLTALASGPFTHGDTPNLAEAR